MFYIYNNWWLQKKKYIIKNKQIIKLVFKILGEVKIINCSGICIFDLQIYRYLVNGFIYCIMLLGNIILGNIYKIKINFIVYIESEYIKI